MCFVCGEGSDHGIFPQGATGCHCVAPVQYIALLAVQPQRALQLEVGGAEGRGCSGGSAYEHHLEVDVRVSGQGTAPLGLQLS